MDLIDRNKLKLHHVWAERHTATGNVCKLVVEVADIEKLPTVDAEPVIRCKDCKHWFYFWESEKHHCTESDKHPWDCPIREEDDFCSRGELKR